MLSFAAGYTNNHKVSMSLIDLDREGDVHLGLVREMREVLQWWCQMKLRHTSTFGLRIYKRGSMLINHLVSWDGGTRQAPCSF